MSNIAPYPAWMLDDLCLSYVRFLWEAEYEAKLAHSFDKMDEFQLWAELYADTARLIEKEFEFDPTPIWGD